MPDGFLDTDSGFGAVSDRVRAATKSYGEKWVGSRFEWLMWLPSRARGTAGENLFAEFCRSHGADVSSSPDVEADRVVGQTRVEVKLSTEWENGGFRFQQLRDQNYQTAALLGVTPGQVFLWLVPKAVVLQHAAGQHTGADATETKWLFVHPDAVPEWLAPYGGPVDGTGPLIRQL